MEDDYDPAASWKYVILKRSSTNAYRVKSCRVTGIPDVSPAGTEGRLNLVVAESAVIYSGDNQYRNES